MARLFVLFSHGQLSKEQSHDAFNSLGVSPDDYVYLPAGMQDHFSNIPPELPSIEEWIAPLKGWLGRESQPGDYVMIQGDFGLVVSMVAFCKAKGLLPLYSTTQRQVITEEDGKKVSIFKHIRFRFY